MNQPAEPQRPEPICGTDSWMPLPARLLNVKEENFNTRTYTFEFIDNKVTQTYRFQPGQFNMVYAPGIGEAAISISSDSEKTGALDHTIRLVGSVTRAIDRIPVGGIVGLRGPFGRGWPLHLIPGNEVVILAGGIGLAPLRPVVYWLLNHRDLCRRVVLLYGCRTPQDRLYAAEVDSWAQTNKIDVLVTVDNATGEWTGPVGVVTNLMRRIKVNAERTIVMVCGPRILNRVAAWNFLQLHVPPDQVFVSLERNMNCGFGRCGHCQYGSKFVCRDGPVFSFAEVSDIFAVEEV